MFNIQPIFIDIQLVKEDEKEYFMCQYLVFYGEYENEKKIGTKKFNRLQQGFELQIFKQVPAQNLNFEED